MNTVVRDSQIFRAADLGIVYRYGSAEMGYDVYVYPKQDWPDPVGQGRVFLDNLETEKRRGRFDSYEVISNEPFNLSVGERVIPGHEVSIRMIRRGEPRHSYMAVVSLPDTYAKFRITRRLENAGSERRFVAAWVEAYLVVEPN